MFSRIEIASGLGLERRECGQGVKILDGPVLLEAWTGKAWARDIRGVAQALRLTFASPPEQILVR